MRDSIFAEALKRLRAGKEDGVMPILVESRGGRLVEVDTNTGKIVDRVEIRDGIAYYMAADGQVLERYPLVGWEEESCHG